MTDDDPRSTTPEERADELTYLIGSVSGTSEVSRSADEDGAVVTCYVYRDHAEEVERLAADSGFDVLHHHAVGDEAHYVFGYSAAE